MVFFLDFPTVALPYDYAPPSTDNAGRVHAPVQAAPGSVREREFFIDNLLVRVHRRVWCTGLAPWEFESRFPGSLISTFLGGRFSQLKCLVRLPRDAGGARASIPRHLEGAFALSMTLHPGPDSMLHPDGA